MGFSFMDSTGVLLTPSERGEKCLGNGNCVDEDGNKIECCCDECDYLMRCFPYTEYESGGGY